MESSEFDELVWHGEALMRKEPLVALNKFLQALLIKPRNQCLYAHILFLQSFVESDKSQHKLALDMTKDGFEAIAKQYPDCPVIYLKLAELFNCRNECEKAIPHAKRAIELYENPKDKFNPYYQLAGAYYNLNRFDESLEILLSIREIYGDRSILVLEALVTVYTKLNDLPKAKECEDRMNLLIKNLPDWLRLSPKS